jgi:hypothetical protein
MTVEKVDPEKWKGIVQRMKDKERMKPDKNVEGVITQLHNRERQGIIKYGVNTERTDLSTLEWLQHLQEELMDASVYIEKLKNEMEDMAGIEWKKDRRGEKGWPKKDFDIQYHGKTKNYKKELQPEND